MMDARREMSPEELTALYVRYVQIHTEAKAEAAERARRKMRAQSIPAATMGEVRRRKAIIEAARKARDGEGVIYVAEVTGADTIKIGYTINTEKMVKRIASDYGVAVKVIGTMQATIMQEKELHSRLREYRNHGPVRGCATEFYPRSVMLTAAFPMELISAIEEMREKSSG